MNDIIKSNDQYEKDVIRYKKKYTRFRCDLTLSTIKKSLEKFGYSLNDLSSLISYNSNELVRVVESICKSLPSSAGSISSILYTSVIGELLDICEIGYNLHVGFVLPVRVNDLSKYSNYLVVDYMYIFGDNGISYHYFNGNTNSDSFTFIKDDIVEV